MRVRLDRTQGVAKMMKSVAKVFLGIVAFVAIGCSSSTTGGGGTTDTGPTVNDTSADTGMMGSTIPEGCQAFYDCCLTIMAGAGMSETESAAKCVEEVQSKNNDKAECEAGHKEYQDKMFCS